MQNLKKVKGVYQINIARDFYIGSTYDLDFRIRSHMSRLKRGRHENKNMQVAFDLNPDCVSVDILHICKDHENPVEVEQDFIDKKCPTLNIRKRAVISMPKNRIGGVPVDCTDGFRYKSFAEAARKYNTNSSHIKNLTGNQVLGVLGVRFKLTSEDWRPSVTGPEVCAEVRRNKCFKHSEETKAKFREQRKGKKFSALATQRRIESVSVSVFGVNIKTAERIDFKSVVSAGKHFNQPNGHSITRVLRGTRKSAFGYKWYYKEGSK